MCFKITQKETSKTYPDIYLYVYNSDTMKIKNAILKIVRIIVRIIASNGSIVILTII